MKIGIEITPAVKNLKAGIPYYTHSLFKHLLRVSSVHKFVFFHHHIKDKENIPAGLLVKDADFVQWSSAPELLLKSSWYFLKRPKFSSLYKGELDLFHYSYDAMVPGVDKGIKKIITIYDITPGLFADTHRFFVAIFFFPRLIDMAVNTADIIITTSENTKLDLIKNYGISRDKIRVVYGGTPDINLSDERISISGMPALRERYNIGNCPYILYVGSIEPRKNLVRAMEAFDKLKEDSKFKDYKFVCVSGMKWNSGKIFKRVNALSCKEDIIFTGPVEEDMALALLYKYSSLFVYPSLYEGFGLPPLEAMHYGAPVVVSNTSSLPEVVGDAAIKVDPYKEEEIYEAMKKVLSEANLRKEMIEKGFLQAKKFSWEKAAKETIAVYEEAYKL